MDLLTTLLMFCSFTIFLDNHLVESAVPPRGTVEFIKYAYNLTDDYPAYWSTPQNYTGYTIVDVDKTTEDAIRKLVYSTWDKDLVGKGDDGSKLNTTALNVLNITRIENPKLFSKYRAGRKEILHARFVGVAPDVASLQGSRGHISTAQLLSQLSQSINLTVYTEINELYFFHGTKVKYINSIAENGFNLSLAGQGQYGKGIYGAERSTKSDEYTDTTGDVQKMLLVRMTLGNVYLVNDEAKRKAIANASQPPDDTYHSVMSDFKNEFLGTFREFIVYNETQFYPEYIIEYNRISSANTFAFSSFHFLMAFVVVNFV